MRTVDILTALSALGVAVNAIPVALNSDETQVLKKRPNDLVSYHGDANEALAARSENAVLEKRPNFKILYRGSEDEALAARSENAVLEKRPNFKILYRGSEDEAL